MARLYRRKLASVSCRDPAMILWDACRWVCSDDALVSAAATSTSSTDDNCADSAVLVSDSADLRWVSVFWMLPNAPDSVPMAVIALESWVRTACAVVCAAGPGVRFANVASDV